MLIRSLLFSLFCMTALQADLQRDINKAASMLGSTPIPARVLRNAKGVVTMSIVKGGFIFSGEVGSGLVVAKLSDGWSAPSALGMGGAGWGFQAGGKITDLILILNTSSAVNAFAVGGNVTLGGSLSVAAGPMGRTAEAGVSLPPAAIYAYGRSRGAFAGVSLEGTVFVERSNINESFYGMPVSARELLRGKIPPPKSANQLYKRLSF